MGDLDTYSKSITNAAAS
jgi:hypothetical protein